jgi:hypothetical protein
MRNLFFLLIISLFLIPNSFAQGNLQFNRVITIISGQNYTVPEGKVLKIESINMSNSTVCVPRSSQATMNCQSQSGTWYSVTYGIYNAITYMTIANMNFTTPSYNGNTNGCNGIVNTSCWNWNFGALSFNTPIWLEDGKQVNVHSGVSSIIISAIEFNVIP